MSTTRCERQPTSSPISRCGFGSADLRGPARTTTRKTAIAALRALLAVVVVLSFANAPSAKAEAAVEYLQVPSAAMGRDIPVAFRGGGPHAVYLLDAFDAGETVSNWMTVGGAAESLSNTDLSVVAPAGGGYSLYADWEQDRTRQWETFLSAELPDWLAANKGLAPGSHGIVGVSQGGTAAIALAARHPERFSYAASLSGFLTPSATSMNGAIAKGMQLFGGVDTQNIWGPVQLGRWRQHDPDALIPQLIDDNTRLWIFSPSTLSASDPASMLGYADQAQGSNRSFYTHYHSQGGRNAHVDFPVAGDHGWSTWAPQLRAMASDLAAWITR